MKNAIFCAKLLFLIVAALIVTAFGVASFLPYAIFRICLTMLDIIEDKAEAIKLELEK